MFINPDLIDRSLMKQSQTKPLQVNSAMNFQKVLEGVTSQQAVESAFTTDKNSINKRKKNSEEIMGEYSEAIEDIYDVLHVQSKIRKIFRKINIKEIG